MALEHCTGLMDPAIQACGRMALLRVKVGLFIQMEVTTKVTLIKERPTEVENSYTQTQHNMTENGSTTANMDTASNHGQMAQFIAVTTAMATKTVKVISLGLTGVPTEAIFQIITYTAMEYTNGQMGGCITVTGQVIKCTGLENLRGQMDDGTMGTMQRIEKKDMVNFPGPMGSSMKECGQMVSSMEQDIM